MVKKFKSNAKSVILIAIWIGNPTKLQNLKISNNFKILKNRILCIFNSERFSTFSNLKSCWNFHIKCKKCEFSCSLYIYCSQIRIMINSNMKICKCRNFCVFKSSTFSYFFNLQRCQIFHMICKKCEFSCNLVKYLKW